MSLHDVTNRDQIRVLLQQWQRRQVTPLDVLVEAERIWESDPLYNNYIPFPRTDSRSVYYSVLLMLEVLHVQLLMREDIPMILAFLDTPAGGEEKAWQLWDAYWDSVDYDDRSKTLQGSDYYTSK